VHESGQLSIWLQRGLERLGLHTICIDARKAHKSLSARPNKSDAADAEGLAQLVEPEQSVQALAGAPWRGWVRPRAVSKAAIIKAKIALRWARILRMLVSEVSVRSDVCGVPDPLISHIFVV